MGKNTSWFWIIFWLIIFWPIGLVLAFNKMTNDKSAVMSGKTGFLSFTGWLLVFLGVCTFAAWTEAPDFFGFVITAFFLGGGVFVIIKARKTKKAGQRYKKYLDLIVNQGYRKIDDMAGIVGLQYEEVLSDLDKMSDIGYLNNYYINIANREIGEKFIQNPVYANNQVVAQPVKTVSVKCPGCGANNVCTSGTVTDCDYCGTPINA